MGVVISHKMRDCGDWKKIIFVKIVTKLVNQKKDFSVNQNEMKREPPNSLAHMLPKYMTT